MLRQTFCHLPGVGPKRERRLWDSGVDSWEALLRSGGAPLSERALDRVRPQLEASVEAIDRRDGGFFARHLPSREHWRLFGAFRDSVAYVDIETTGGRVGAGAITTIALYDGRCVRHYVRGENLETFPTDLLDYDVVVTYNGKAFDIPWIEHAFGIRVRHAHIDLRPVLHSMGIRGGLKRCERQLGIGRGSLDGIEGEHAVLLWRAYARSGDDRALRTLLAYNVEDVLTLEILLTRAFNRKAGQTPFSHRLALPEPSPAANPFTPDPDLVGRLRSADVMSKISLAPLGERDARRQPHA